MSRRTGWAGWLVIVYSALVLALTVVHVVAPQRSGPLALTQVFEPHSYLPLVALLPLAAWRLGTRALVTVAVVALVGLARFGPGMVSLPQSALAGESVVEVASWNLYQEHVESTLLVDVLLAADADIVGLQELQPSDVRAIEQSAELTERYPHRILRPNGGVRGMGLLSAFPLTERDAGRDPPFVLADVALPDGRTMAALNGHPLPPRMGLMGGVPPTSYDTSERDAHIAQLRALVQPNLEAGDPVLVIGDFNVTDREPAYWDLAAGLKDAHLETGLGTGSTLRPYHLAGGPLAVLRIDYVLTGGSARPISSSVDCVPGGGDHCLVRATVAIGSR